jgi:hypothetical protein
MKKLLLVGVAVAVGIVAIVLMRDRFGMKMFSRSEQSGDLVIVNDSSENISTEFKEASKETDQVVQPGGQATGGQGFIRIFTAKKAGSYELTYEFPRPAGTAQKVSLSQIVAAATNENFGDAVITKKGMIGDISIEYEEARQLDSTY